MKKLMTMIVFVLALGSKAIAQVSALHLRTTSNIPIKVVLDGQLVSENANIAVINNIPSGHHHLQVFYNIQDYFGVREEVLFLGKVFLPPSIATHAVVNESQQYIIEQQVAFHPNPNPVGHGNYTYNPNHNSFDNQYAVKPIFWTGQEPQKPHCNIPPPAFQQANPVVEVFPIHNNDFHLLKTAINAQWFSEGKMNVLNQALAHHHFTSLQVKELIDLFTYSQDRLTVAKNAYHKTLDQANYFVVYESLHWNRSIQNLSNYIASL